MSAKQWFLLVFSCFLMFCPLIAQDDVTADPPANQASAEADSPVEVDETVSESLEYKPLLDESGAVRDPFKSPFELEQERRKQEEERMKNQVVDRTDRLEYQIGDLTLRGIYLEPSVGYVALFEVADNTTDWYQIGTKFYDGDLVNITDNSVHFTRIDLSSGQPTGDGEYVIELHRDN